MKKRKRRRPENGFATALADAMMASYVLTLLKDAFSGTRPRKTKTRRAKRKDHQSGPKRRKGKR